MATAPKAVNWNLPTTNTDGSPLSTGEVTGYTVGVGTVSGTYTILTTVKDPKATSEPLNALSAVLQPGTYFAAVRTESSFGTPSAWSNEASFTIPVPVPNPPTGFTAS